MVLSYQIQKLETQLAGVSRLIGEYQHGEPAFCPHTIAWLEEVEKLLSQLRLPGSSEIATLKGKILSVEDSLRSHGEPPPRSRIRSARNMAAMNAIERAEQMMRGNVTEADAKLNEFEQKIREGLTALLLKAPIPPRYQPLQSWLGDVWQIFADFEPTRGYALYLASSLSMADRLYLLQMVLSRMQSRAAAEIAAA